MQHHLKFHLHLNTGFKTGILDFYKDDEANTPWQLMHERIIELGTEQLTPSFILAIKPKETGSLASSWGHVNSAQLT